MSHPNLISNDNRDGRFCQGGKRREVIFAVAGKVTSVFALLEAMLKQERKEVMRDGKH